MVVNTVKTSGTTTKTISDNLAHLSVFLKAAIDLISK